MNLSQDAKVKAVMQTKLSKEGKQPEPQLFQKGYETYAVTKGGKGIIEGTRNLLYRGT